ncbi:aldose 1-epimerase family protein [bacterium]|nr:aldose 1-epimerase family protein [bacterium]
MPILWGRKYARQELLDRVGDISQVGGARKIMFDDGPHKGVEAVEFRTGSGLNFTVVPGRGMDITIAEHNGRPLSWRTAAGELTPALYEEPGLGWLRSFPGGLVATCGLTYLGSPCEDMGESLGIHGRIANTPASNVYVDGEWYGDEYKMWAIGKVRESRVFGENVTLRRKVSALLGESKLSIHDIVTNEGPRRTPHMILYHINGGFPALDEGSLFISPTLHAAPRDTDAEVDEEHFYRMDAPTAGFVERCYYHEMAADPDGWVQAALINKNMPAGDVFGFYVRYNKSELPNFIEWKMNGTQEYVVGMEPANCLVEGRAKERERGTLQFLKPGESREYHIEIGVLADADEVAEFEDSVSQIKGS